MRLADLERTDDGEFPRFVTRVRDVAGIEEFELRIAGPGKLVEEMLADSTIELKIESTKDRSQLKQKLETPPEEHRRAVWELAALDEIDQLLKPSPSPPKRESSVFTSIRPVSGEGSLITLGADNVPIPAKASWYVGGWWTERAGGSVAPASGDQDLFLHYFAPTGPVVAASTLPGSATETVLVDWPWIWISWFQVFGFTAGVVSQARFALYTDF
jgi:hypothetical protein